MQTSFSYRINGEERWNRLQDLTGQISCDLHCQQARGILVAQLAEVERGISEGVNGLNNALFRCILNLPISEANREYVGRIVRNLRVQGSDVEKNGCLLIDDAGDGALL